MQRIRLAGAAAAVLAAALGVLAVSAGGQGPAPSPADFTVTVTNHESRLFVVDNAPRGRSTPGDMLGGRASISGARSGSFDFHCVQVRGRVLLCQGASTFADGVIYRRARLTADDGTERFAIVGGTGAYDGAKGTIVSVEQSDRGGRRITQETYGFAE